MRPISQLRWPLAALIISLLSVTGCGEAPGGDGDTEENPCTEDECGPAPGAPNHLCDDGVTNAGPGPCQRQGDGGCGWTMVQCPEPEACSEDTCQDQADTCDGTQVNPGWVRQCDPESGECVDSTAEQPYDCADDGQACLDGACVEGEADLCEDVVCEPIAAYCPDEATLRGESPTSCDPATGECVAVESSDAQPINCGENGGACVDGACVQGEPDLCADVTCDNAEPYCDGDTAVYAVLFTCNPESGECEISAAEGPENCDEIGLVCVDGGCVEGEPDLCADVACASTLPYCDGDTAVYAALYTCNPESGECEISAAEGPENCDEIGLVCVDGGCVQGEPDLCADVACASTPPYCEGDTAYSGVYQECMPETGECVTAPGLPPEDCSEQGMVCLEGECQAPACDDGACGPMPGMPNTLCDDGVTTSGPSDCEMQEGGACGWTIVECPDAETCTPDENIEAGDGCNTCVCAESGLVSESFNCTKKACMCETSKECDDGFFCDYPNDDCGIGGSMGNCAALPEACDDGGEGACGCGPVSTTNACEQQAMGYDVFTYGGCTLGSEETFACGDTTCMAEGELCAISMNDVMGPDQPLFFNSCGTLEDGCSQGNCDCMTTDPWSKCYDETGYTIVFYMGG